MNPKREFCRETRVHTASAARCRAISSMFAKPKSELNYLAADVQRCWELGDKAGFASVMAPNAKMSVPHFGVSAQGLAAMWAVRENASSKEINLIPKAYEICPVVGWGFVR